MPAHRAHINRVLPRDVPRGKDGVKGKLAEQSRNSRFLAVDFSSLQLPDAVCHLLAEAFWNQVDVKSDRTVYGYWYNLKTFARFVAETQAVRGLTDVRSEVLARYIEWLNAQCDQDGKPWSKTTRYSRYMTLRTLLRWVQRCRPGVLGEIEFPFNPFSWKNRDSRGVEKLSAQTLHAILKACEQDITRLRMLRATADRELASTHDSSIDSISTRGELFQLIDRHFGGVVPSSSKLRGRGSASFTRAFRTYGGRPRIRECLYPVSGALLPYYLAILIHTAGNPEAIAALHCDCLQPMPLLDDRELLVWAKPRAGAVQQRSFHSTASFEPPTLVREILHWTKRLRPHVAAADRNRLFLLWANSRVAALSGVLASHSLPVFRTRHHLPRFSLASIRPTVLSMYYRASGDLREVAAVANHAHLSTTIGYVESPEVEAQNRVRVAALQSAFLGHVEHPTGNDGPPTTPRRTQSPPSGQPPSATPAVSMFGFDCKDPFAGIAPGTRPGELCTNFLGCFTCPNAVITADAASLARVLHARDHLRAATGHLHPARWEGIYAPALRILEEDILTRFSAKELAAAEPLRGALPPLPELR
ncbi:MAG: hypothetical protein WBW93_15260 [Steroidobacteraceae bacterium]